MKKIIFTLLSLSLFVVVKAQKINPEIKAGTIMQCSAYVQGQEIPLFFTVKNTTAPILAWSVEGYGDGTFEMSEKALESATQLFTTSQPALGATKLVDTETFGLISKAAYKSLVDTKTFTYGGLKFKVKDGAPVKVGGKEIDVTHVVSEDGKLELWILNNPAFPLLVQSEGLSTDIVVHEIK